jgi:hypothetical protein
VQNISQQRRGRVSQVAVAVCTLGSNLQAPLLDERDDDRSIEGAHDLPQGVRARFGGKGSTKGIRF